MREFDVRRSSPRSRRTTPSPAAASILNDKNNDNDNNDNNDNSNENNNDNNKFSSHNIVLIIY